MVEVAEEQLTEFFSTVMPLLDERQRRVVAGAGAKMLGRGGVSTRRAGGGDEPQHGDHRGEGDRLRRDGAEPAGAPGGRRPQAP